MDTHQFWHLINQAKDESKGDIEKQAAILVDRLTSLSLEEILSYQRIFDQLNGNAQQYDLLEVADLIYGGIGDSGWKDFKAWLIGQGKTVYDNVINDPEALVDLVSLENRENIAAESLIYVAQEAADRKTGTNFVLPPSEYKLLTGENLWKDATVEEHDRLVKERFPRVWAKFGW